MLHTLAYWVHDLDPIILPIHGDIAVRWYGLSYVTAFVIGFILLRLAWKKGRSPLSPQQSDDLAFWAVLGVLIGGRLGFMLLYDLPLFLENPFSIVMITKGGMSFHGGALGAVAAFVLYSWRRNVDVRRVGDVLAMATPPGLLLGRIANFINGELWGHVSTVPWAIVFPAAPHVEGAPTVDYMREGVLVAGNPRHPSQLYEAALEGLLLGIYLQLRFWLRDPKKSTPGMIGAEFVTGYAILRIVAEMFRVPDASLFFGLSRGTFYSLLMLAVGVFLIFWLRAIHKRKLARDGSDPA